MGLSKSNLADFDVFWRAMPTLSDLLSLFENSDKAFRALAGRVDDIGEAFALPPD